MADDTTPLSNMMKPVLEGAGPQAFADFHAALLGAELGVTANGIPGGHDGVFVTGRDGQLTMPFFQAGEFRFLVRACADPAAFAIRFGSPGNAVMRGRVLLEMVLQMPEAEGLLVCSAASFQSIMIPREDIRQWFERLSSELDRRPKTGD